MEKTTAEKLSEAQKILASIKDEKCNFFFTAILQREDDIEAYSTSKGSFNEIATCFALEVKENPILQTVFDAAIYAAHKK